MKCSTAVCSSSAVPAKRAASATSTSFWVSLLRTMGVPPSNTHFDAFVCHRMEPCGLPPSSAAKPPCRSSPSWASLILEAEQFDRVGEFFRHRDVEPLAGRQGLQEPSLVDPAKLPRLRQPLERVRDE